MKAKTKRYISAYCYFGVYRKGKGGKRNEKA